MSRRAKLRLITLGILVAVGAVCLWAYQARDRLGLARGPDALLARVRAEAPLLEAVRQQEKLDLVALAEEHAEFRRWLAGILASADVVYGARRAVLKVLWQVKGDEAIRDIVETALPWLQKPWDDHLERGLQRMFIDDMLWRSLLTSDLPSEELLRLFDEGDPGWRTGHEPYLKDGPTRWRVPPDEPDKKRAARFAQMLALARSRDEARLLERLRAEAPLPPGPEPTIAGLPGLAEGDPAVRKWLAAIVASSDEDYWARVIAFKALFDMNSDDALRGLVDDLHAWLRNRDVMYTTHHMQLAGLLLDRVLLTDLPIKDVRELAERSFRFWKTRAGAEAGGHWLGDEPWTAEQRARIQERARQLMSFAKTGRAPGAQHPGAPGADRGKPEDDAETR